MRPHRKKNLVYVYANNKSTDQSVHPHSLVSVFALRCLDKISFSRKSTSSKRNVVERGCWESTKTGFLSTDPMY